MGYDETPVLRNLDLRIDMDDRIALIGANGNGKSTLVKLLAGRLNPMGGKLVKSSKLKVGYFTNGNELKAPTEKLKYGEINNSNHYSVFSLLNKKYIES